MKRHDVSTPLGAAPEAHPGGAELSGEVSSCCKSYAAGSGLAPAWQMQRSLLAAALAVRRWSEPSAGLAAAPEGPLGHAARERVMSSKATKRRNRVRVHEAFVARFPQMAALLLRQAGWRSWAMIPNPADPPRWQAPHASHWQNLLTLEQAYLRLQELRDA